MRVRLALLFFCVSGWAAVGGVERDLLRLVNLSGVAGIVDERAESTKKILENSSQRWGELTFQWRVG